MDHILLLKIFIDFTLLTHQTQLDILTPIYFYNLISCLSSPAPSWLSCTTELSNPHEPSVFYPYCSCPTLESLFLPLLLVKLLFIFKTQIKWHIWKSTMTHPRRNILSSAMHHFIDKHNTMLISCDFSRMDFSLIIRTTVIMNTCGVFTICRHCAVPFMLLISFGPHYNTIRWMLFYSYSKDEQTDTENVCN